MYILICDDDIAYAKRCESKIRCLAAVNGIEAKIDIAKSGENLLLFSDTKFAKADLIYLDWHLPQMNGLETARQLRKSGIMADIVFYTVDESHAIDGYDVEALHYIVKGKTASEKFDAIFLKAAERMEQRCTEVLTASCAGEHQNIPLRDILYIEVHARIVTIHYFDHKKLTQFEFYSTLSKIEEFLFGKDFIRIHSSYLVGTRFIKKKTTREIELTTGKILPVGKNYRKNMK